MYCMHYNSTHTDTHIATRTHIDMDIDRHIRNTWWVGGVNIREGISYTYLYVLTEIAHTDDERDDEGHRDGLIPGGRRASIFYTRVSALRGVSLLCVVLGGGGGGGGEQLG